MVISGILIQMSPPNIKMCVFLFFFIVIMEVDIVHFYENWAKLLRMMMFMKYGRLYSKSVFFGRECFNFSLEDVLVSLVTHLAQPPSAEPPLLEHSEAV